MHSPIGCSAQFCSVLFKVSLSDIRGVNRSLALQLYNADVYRHRDDVNAICELMDVKRVIWS